MMMIMRTILWKDVFQFYYENVTGRPNMKGGKYRINMPPTTVMFISGSHDGKSQWPHGA